MSALDVLPNSQADGRQINWAVIVAGFFISKYFSIDTDVVGIRLQQVIQRVSKRLNMIDVNMNSNRLQSIVTNVLFYLNHIQLISKTDCSIIHKLHILTIFMKHLQRANTYNYVTPFYIILKTVIPSLQQDKIRSFRFHLINALSWHTLVLSICFHD